MDSILHLESGYAKPRYDGAKAYRPMTIEEFKELHGSFPVRAFAGKASGKVFEARTNGKPKTWKTRPLDVSVPCKYGMYEYFTISMVNGEYTDIVPLVEL